MQPISQKKLKMSIHGLKGTGNLFRWLCLNRNSFMEPSPKNPRPNSLICLDHSAFRPFDFFFFLKLHKGKWILLSALLHCQKDETEFPECTVLIQKYICEKKYEFNVYKQLPAFSIFKSNQFSFKAHTSGMSFNLMH